MKNQDDNQLENQVDFFNESISSSFDESEDENIVCNIYKEQFDLINELPMEERLKVLYIAVSKAFYETEKNQDDNQLENQDENTYISISISIYNSISNYSKKLLKLLFKTINCKNYKNWGGKRNNSGRKKQEKTIKPLDISENREPIKKVDPFTNPLIDKCFEVYKTKCPNLLKLGFEPRNAKIREQLNDFLIEIDSDIGYFTELCEKANKLKEIVHKTIDFKSLITNHIGIMNGKYKDNDTFDYNEWLKEQQINESG